MERETLKIDRANLIPHELVVDNNGCACILGHVFSHKGIHYGNDTDWHDALDDIRDLYPSREDFWPEDSCPEAWKAYDASFWGTEPWRFNSWEEQHCALMFPAEADEQEFIGLTEEVFPDIEIELYGEYDATRYAELWDMLTEEEEANEL